MGYHIQQKILLFTFQVEDILPSIKKFVFSSLIRSVLFGNELLQINNLYCSI